MLASACNPPLPIQHQQPDSHAQYRTAQDITGKMHVQVQAGERDEHCQRDGRPAKPPVRRRQDGGTDGPGHRMTGWERVVAGAGDQQWYALVQPAGARAGDEALQTYVAHQHADRQTAEQKKPSAKSPGSTESSMCRKLRTA